VKTEKKRSGKLIVVLVCIILLFAAAVDTNESFFVRQGLKDLVMDSGVFKVVEVVYRVYYEWKNPEVLLGSLSPEFNKQMAVTLESKFLQEPAYRVIEYHDPDLKKTPYSFSYTDFNNPHLKKLRDSYQLDKLVQNKTNDLDKVIALSNWIHENLKKGVSIMKVVKYAFDAQKLLDYRFESNYQCNQFSYIFMNCSLAIGITSRFNYVFPARLTKEELEKYHSQPKQILKLIKKRAAKFSRLLSHCINEVWLNEYGKWAMIDTFYNQYFVDQNNVPLSVQELRQRLINWDIDNIFLMRGTQREKIPVSSKNGRGEIIWYYNLYYIMGNDFYRFNDSTITPGVRWSPQEANWSDESIHHRSSDLLLSKKEEIDWDLNKVKILFGKREAKCVPILLDTVTPDFDYCEITVEGKAQKNTTNEFKWCLKEGINTLKVTSVNKLQHKGIPSRLEFSLKMEIPP
jgi:hypothetical protein